VPRPLKAQVPYVTVRRSTSRCTATPAKSENLLEAVRWAERTLEVCKVAFPWSYADGPWPMEWAFFTAKETYQQILKANKRARPRVEARTLSTSGIGNVRVGATSGKQVLFDACVRNVASLYSGFGSDGYAEGIGHTFVGMIFNNNRLFSVDLKKQEGTAASEEDREFQSPDFDVWKNLSLEMAWRRSPAACRPTSCRSATRRTFTNEERIKAWSFCDYLMRRDPEMLRAMDQIALEMKKKRHQAAGRVRAAVQREVPRGVDRAARQGVGGLLDRRLAGAEGDPEQHAAARAPSARASTSGSRPTTAPARRSARRRRPGRRTSRRAARTTRSI
jgi:hypothetical protein